MLNVAIRTHASSVSKHQILLLNQFDLFRFPCLFKPRFERTVEPQDRKPAFARHRLNPIGLLASGHLGTEVDGARTIVVPLWIAALAAQTGLGGTWRLQQGSGLWIIQRH